MTWIIGFLIALATIIITVFVALLMLRWCDEIDNDEHEKH